ncbi:hypothetical protein FOCC_FOCC003484 [Frankliniella occidentalis]|uniref:Uncharacterized protein LOC113211323 n=1 Tax=Frankliniella occidentalis TaxID=133901 RepID=A0A6J1T1J3_FRAOC|nr:uncharacterized protein LOC113211323 [Frankliniella occidentalis]KAE8749744.1 hypothetical protein FOCC_FOCC003484 [Frankliniella occidentalis]
MNAAGNHEFCHAMSSLKKCATLDDDICETRDDAVEDSSLKTLKKARFVWQIKGNYHLKNSNCDSESRESSVCSQSVDSTSAVTESMSRNSNTSAFETITDMEHSPPPCEHHPPATQSGSELTIEDQRPSLPPLRIGPFCDRHPPTAQPGTASTNEGQHPPLPPLRIGATTVSCVVCDTFNENIRRASLSHDGERPSTPRLPTSHPDWNVRKWQTRQIAKAFMDNTINCVLEEMGFNPSLESAPDSDLDDVLSSINFPRADDDSGEEEEEDESVENEGILSAIQSHGLQRHTLQSISDVSSQYRYTISSPTECSSSSPSTWGPNQQSRHPMYDADGTDRTSDSTSDDDDEEEAGCTQDTCVSSSCKCMHSPIPKVNGVSQSSMCSTSISNVALEISDSLVARQSSNSSRSDEKNKIPSLISQREHLRIIGTEDEICKKRQGKESVNSSFSKRRCVDSTDEDSKSSFTSSSQSTSSPDLEAGVISIASQSSGRNSPTFGHFEFMDAAVAVAIQKKGLSALACQEL